MVRSLRALALPVLVSLVASSGLACEKHPPAATTPNSQTNSQTEDERPPVVVEDPGATPKQPQPDPADGEAGDEPEFGRTEIVPTDIACQSDADCVKDSCCHASGCVAAADKPDCSSVMCTADCQAGTMDCNGGCVCQDGTCAAKLWYAPTDN